MHAKFQMGSREKLLQTRFLGGDPKKSFDCVQLRFFLLSKKNSEAEEEGQIVKDDVAFSNVNFF